jgi:hypothetical protein
VGGPLSVIRQGDSQEVLTKTHHIHYTKGNEGGEMQIFTYTDRYRKWPSLTAAFAEIRKYNKEHPDETWFIVKDDHDDE